MGDDIRENERNNKHGRKQGPAGLYLLVRLTFIVINPTEAYLLLNRDMQKALLNALLHYLMILKEHPKCSKEKYKISSLTTN